ncbi:MAG TPA: winged helix-turn-helix domain-containing protein [Nitrososphaera sp.]|jgi:predicted transcriptional regulator
MLDSHYEPRIERHRSKVDIVYDILVSAMGGGAKKTHILYKANISSTQAESYFSALLAHNLLENALDIDDNNIYRTTEKGMRFIECCEEIRSLIGIVMNNRRIDPMSDFYAFDRHRC